MKQLTHAEVAKRGGMSTKKKYGKEHYKKIQLKSVKQRKENNETRRKEV